MPERPDGLALVIIPTYNELDNLFTTAWLTLGATSERVHLLIVDDASPDGTGLVADRLAQEHARVHVLHRPAKAGLGPAYRSGFAWALARGYASVVEMDADGSHDPADIVRLLGGLRDHDLVLGSRWMPGGGVTDWPLRRQLLSRGGNRYVRVALGIDIRDATGGFRAFRTDALRELQIETVSSQGYCFQVDMLWRTLRSGLRVGEVPITFRDRTAGSSKMSPRIVLESLARVTLWGLQRHGRALIGAALRPMPRRKLQHPHPPST